jgi:hypothetical protein
MARSGNPTGAIPYMDEALRLGTRDARLLVHAAIIRDAVGDRVGARDALASAAATNPWCSFGLQSETIALADRLGVDWPRVVPT